MMKAILGFTLTIAALMVASPAIAATCTAADKPVTITHAMAPTYPASALKLHAGRQTVLIHVAVTATGNVKSATIAESSNNQAIDQAALRAARQSTYAPATHQCAPISGTYVFRADFNPTH